MTNPVKGEVPLTLTDGRQFTMVLDMEAMIEAEGVYRQPLARLLVDAASGFVGASRALLYGTLRAHHRDVTVSDAANIIGSDAESVTSALEAAIDAAYPSPTEGKERANPPGKTSGVNGVKRGSSRKPSGGPRRAASE